MLTLRYVLFHQFGVDIAEEMVNLTIMGFTYGFSVSLLKPILPHIVEH